MTRLQVIRKLMPLILPVVAVVAMAIVTIKLSCIDGMTACENVSEMASQMPQPSIFSEWLNLWHFG